MLSEGEHVFFIADLANDEAIFKLASELPILDGIVLNAGLVKTVPVRFIKREVMDDMFNLNIQGSILLIQQLIKLKKIKTEPQYVLYHPLHHKKLLWEMQFIVQQKEL